MKLQPVTEKEDTISLGPSDGDDYRGSVLRQQTALDNMKTLATIALCGAS
jgi:hypothetical protein